MPFVSSLRAFLASKVSPVGDFRLVSPLRGADAVPSLTKDDLQEPLRLWTTVPSHPAALGSLVLVLGPSPPSPASLPLVGAGVGASVRPCVQSRAGTEGQACLCERRGACSSPGVSQGQC